MTLQVEVVSADQKVWSGAASEVQARTVEGGLGIMTGHEPLLAILADGEIRITTEGGNRVTAHSRGGFLSVERNTVTIVTTDAALDE